MSHAKTSYTLQQWLEYFDPFLNHHWIGWPNQALYEVVCEHY